MNTASCAACATDGARRPSITCILAPSSLICFRLVAIDLSAAWKSLLPDSAQRFGQPVNDFRLRPDRVVKGCHGPCQDRDRFILLCHSAQDLVLPGEEAVQLQVKGGLTHWRLLTAFASRERCNGLIPLIPLNRPGATR
jgi:hypothetical protein